ncbi:MAG: hypothetical protein Q7J73_06680, partial [Dehalococcoidales bacterium]|nr:hypothetical protein [Dehalococcoidales bacterium]
GWTRAASISTSTESSIVKVGSQSLKFTASSTEDAVVRKTFASAQDWSGYERISFWIYADRLATSTATTTQLLTFQIYDANNPSMIQQNINVWKEDRWQYEEVVLNSTGTAAYDGVTYIQFRTDWASTEDINFYVDQIRAYNQTERAAEMFVDKDGALVVTGRGGVELVAPQSGAGTLPGVKVSGAIVELGQPLSVNVGGDVGFDYDIQFLGTGLSQITSEGPLRIAGGDANHAENLTITVGGTGDIIAELANASSTFMITQAAYASTTAFIINSEINSTSTPAAGLFQIITDVNSDESVKFVINPAGQVGIASSTPSAQLAVAGSIIGSGNIVLYGTTATSTFGAGIQATQVKITGPVAPSAGQVLTATDVLGNASWQTAAAGSGGSNWNFISATAIRPTSTVGIIISASSTFAGNVSIGTSSDNKPTMFVDSGNGRVGIASSTPSAALGVQGNIIGSGNLTMYGANVTSTFYHPVQILDSSNAPMRVSQSASQYSVFQTNASGDLTIVLTGDELIIDDNLEVCSGSCPAFSFTGNGNLIVEDEL